jgi:uncharacterized SAM-binding protein YcdF (DUF218 family)
MFSQFVTYLISLWIYLTMIQSYTKHASFQLVIESNHEDLSLTNNTISAKETIIVVLGCSMNFIQTDRVNKAIEYYINETQNGKKVIWFLTGGVKNAVGNQMTEGSQMTNHVLSQDTFTLEKHNIIIDENAKNTAENFAYLRQWLHNNYSRDNYPDIVITTSSFHHKRASKLLHGIFEGKINPTWNLSDAACSSCWNDETTHIQNVDNDIQKASHIFTSNLFQEF